MKLRSLLSTRYWRTVLALGGGPLASLRLVVQVLRSEGPHGLWWRLRNAGQVAEGELDPWRHFFLEGGQENPFALQRLEQLWSGQDDSLLADLQVLQKATKNQHHREIAAWTLGRWYARKERWPDALHAMETAITRRPITRAPLGVVLLWVDVLRHNGRRAQALQVLSQTATHTRSVQESADLDLARANLLRPAASQPTTAWLEVVNTPLIRAELVPLALSEDNSVGLQINRVRAAASRPTDNGPLVSVVVPAFNAAHSLPMVLNCLAAQSWRMLEVLVVDDGSADETAEIAEGFAAQDGRFRLIRLGQNQGAYAARNTGMAQARGQFLTVHDADDWSHPQKIALQAQALLEQPKAMVSFSHLVRCSADLVFGSWKSPAYWHAWVVRNTSMMMLRRSAFERLGYWDDVRCSADAEYYYRALKVFGAPAMVDAVPGVPLSLCVVEANSLTQTSDTHMFTLFGGLRKQYHDAFQQWHQQFDAADPRSLHLERHSKQRPFPVPAGMLRKSAPSVNRNGSGEPNQAGR